MDTEMKPIAIEIKDESAAASGMQRALVACGILSSALFFVTDIAAAILTRGYSYFSQNSGELFATGAPTRGLLVILYSIYNLLVVLFGVGIWTSASYRTSLRFTGLLLVAYALAGQARLLFFPMHGGAEERAISDNMNIIFTGLIVLLVLLAVGYGASAFGKRFRRYSVGTIVVLILFAIGASINNTRIEEHLSTPALGIIERVYWYGTLLWIAMLSRILLRGGKW